MKLVYLVDFEIPSKSAGSVHVMKMCEAFSQNGHEVTLVCLQNQHEQMDVYAHYGVIRSFSIRFVHVPIVRGRLLIFALRARKVIRELNPDLVYSRSVLGLAFTGSRYASILEVHKPVWEYGWIYKWCFDKIIGSKKFVHLVVISEALRSIFTSRYNNLNYCVAHDGATLPVEPPSEIQLPYFAAQAGYVGNIYKGRGIELLVELARRMPEVGFHIVGGTSSQLGKLGITNIPENLVCHGYISPAMVHSYRKKFDILLAPYQQNVETIGGSKTVNYMSPLKIFEYMSEGKPIIASDFPVLREVLNENNAILVRADNIDAWQKALHKVKDKALGDRLSSAAYSDFVNHYTWKARAEKVLKVVAV